MRRWARFLILAAALPAVSSAQSGRDRINRARYGSEQPVEVPGGQSFVVQVPIDRAFDLVLNGLKRDGSAIDEADRVIGRIVTGLTVTGGWTQTGRRVVVVFIKDTPTQTTVRVAVTLQTRHQLMGAAKPWSTPKLDGAESISAAAKIKDLLNVKE